MTGPESSPQQEKPTPPASAKQQVVLGLIACLGMLPLSLARSIGATLGTLGWWCKTSGAKTTLRNIQMCFPELPDEEQKALAKSSLQHTGMLAFEVCLLLRRSQRWLDSKILHVDDTSMKQAVAQGKGVILLAPHIGNWEVLSRLLPQYGSMTALYQPPKQAYLEDVIIKARQKTGAELVPTTRKGVLKLMNSVKNGGITAILPDQNPMQGSGQFAPFYGHPAFTMTLIHGFVRRVQCPVVVGVVKRVKGGFEVHYFDAPAEIHAEDQDTALQALNLAVQQSVEYCPEQYQWEYKRFKVRAEGDPDPYRQNPFEKQGK
ncbi:Lipid A biosynthesis lauroyltransferase [Thalassocella blandensis]|nr:Lipid A biosynthesis lauroyltransferase [Thalassocella blandensis]